MSHRSSHILIFNHFYFTVEYKYLKTHMKECGKLWECTSCSLKFKQKRTFSAHFKKKHGGILSTINVNNKTIN